MSTTPLGRFCWYELMTTEPDAAKAFYAAVMGWGTETWEGSADMDYTMWMNGETPLGGLMELPEEAAASGAPPHWLPYVSTPDLDATKARAVELGARTLAGPMDIPDVGRVWIFQDPQGGVMAAFQPEGEAPGSDAPAEVGMFSWHELACDDWEAAFGFYSDLFGWTETDAMDMGGGNLYQMYGRGAHPLGGMFNRPPEMPVTAWLLYVRVADVNTAVAAVEEGGGQVLNGPMEVPGGDMIAQCRDPQGAMFAVHSVGGA